jgi:hypothetical protein
MKNRFLSYVVLAISLFSLPAFSQTEETDDTLLGLPGDNLDLFAVLDLFQQSPSIEDFEKSLNLEEPGINNLDLDLDGKIDFIKVVTEQEGDDFSFILQVDVSETETQDVAVILLSKDKNDDITLQMVGDKDLYGKNYVIEPAPPTPAVTANPAYTGTEPVTSTPATTTVVVVESAPVVQYVYSPVYMPYYPPYTYAYPPPYFRAAAVIAVGVYRHNHYYHYNGYHGGYHGNTVVVHNHNTYNNYERNSSREVERNRESGNYDNRSRESRSSTSTADRQQRASSEGSRSSTSTADRQQKASSEGSRSSTSTADRQQRASSADKQQRASSGSSRSSSSPSASQSRGYSQSRSMGSSPSRSAGASRPSGGGGRRR